MVRDVMSFSGGDYQVNLETVSGETLVLSHLGQRYDPFIRVLGSNRHEVLIRDMLIYESRVSLSATAHVDWNPVTGVPAAGASRFRPYDTALIILPPGGDPLRIPYGDIASLTREGFALKLETDWGETYELSRMGPSLEPFHKALSQAMAEFFRQAQESLKNLAPGVPARLIREAAALLKEGKAAERRDIEAVSPELWESLERRLDSFGVESEYRFLLSMSMADRLSIGYKRGLMGELTGDYMWFLMPVWEHEDGKAGNALAMEAVSDEGASRATYFFRIVPRGEYRALLGQPGAGARIDQAIAGVNQAMRAINFRREPIYLAAERLNEPRYSHYRYAVAKIPSLRDLRARFIGRVMHRSAQQWERDVMDLLRLNVSSGDDDREWRNRDNYPREGGD